MMEGRLSVSREDLASSGNGYKGRLQRLFQRRISASEWEERGHNREAIEKLQAVVDRELAGRDGIRVLDAGCGARSSLSFPPDAHMIGIDTSALQLERNPVIDEPIVGDIQTLDLPTDLDVIVCWDVLEHLPHPELALERFVRSVKPGGIIVIKSPNMMSVKGLVTKMTPHRFHVWVWRDLVGLEGAGTEDRAPFRTYLRRSIAPEAIKRFGVENGFSIIYFRLHENQQQKELRRNYKMTGGAWNAVKNVVDAMSFGKVTAEFTDYAIVLKKEPLGGIQGEEPRVRS